MSMTHNSWVIIHDSRKKGSRCFLKLAFNQSKERMLHQFWQYRWLLWWEGGVPKVFWKSWTIMNHENSWRFMNLNKLLTIVARSWPLRLYFILLYYRGGDRRRRSTGVLTKLYLGCLRGEGGKGGSDDVYNKDRVIWFQIKVTLNNQIWPIMIANEHEVHERTRIHSRMNKNVQK